MRRPTRARVVFALLTGLVVASAMSAALPPKTAAAMARLTGDHAPTVCVAAAGALAAWAWRSFSAGAAAIGLILACAIVAAFGVGGLVWLAVGLVLTVAATRLGHARKAAAGIAQPHEGRRGAGNVLANVGPSAAAAFVAATSDTTLAGIACVAALATSVGDTVATEIGQASRGLPRLLTTGARVPAGTPGAVSLGGVAAGTAAALVLAASGALAGMMPSAAVGTVVVCAVAASLAEGVLAVTLEAGGWLDNDGVNLVAALTGAILAVGAWAALSTTP